MAFKVLTDEEISLLNHHQKEMYMEEYELYKERCAFVDKIEKLRNVKFPEFKLDYINLKKISPRKVEENYNLEEPKIILGDVFPSNMLERKDDMEKIHKITQEIEPEYIIENNNRIVIPFFEGKRYGAPEMEGLEFPQIDVKARETDLNFEFENVGDIHVGLDINGYSHIPEVMEYEGVKYALEKTNVYVATCEEITVNPVADTTVSMAGVVIADAKKVEFKQIENELDEIEKVFFRSPNYIYQKVDDYRVENPEKNICELPLVILDEINENVIQLEEVKIAETPEVSNISFENTNVSIDEMRVFEEREYGEITFDDINVNCEIPNFASVPGVKFVSPELQIDTSEILISSPLNVEGHVRETLKLITSCTGDAYEK